MHGSYTGMPFREQPLHHKQSWCILCLLKGFSVLLFNLFTYPHSVDELVDGPGPNWPEGVVVGFNEPHVEV